MNEKVNEALERLEQGIASLLDTEQWKRYLMFQSRFHSYSFHNTLLIFVQKPDATMVAGFHRWKELGRFVRKGERGISILAPMFRTKCDDEGMSGIEPQPSSGEEEKRQILYGFRPVYVFDVAQTDGEPIPTVDVPTIMNGHTGWYESLCRACPFPLREVPEMEGGALGTFHHRSRSIEIVETLPEAQKAKVLIHEWAHGLLHSLADRPNRETRELEAESTAFVVASALGFDTADYSFGYIVGWSGEEAIQTLKACGTRIQKSADTILSALQLQPQVKKEAV
ncbi:ArdC-like ssDNA-binding domain-containing protein [Alicyclobacillus ferrooxydans]|uniref:Uncharacterized protein n=1 Tax=Alicyclobacillus ferrooxydans TaxID=471514 RepID=A0A0P9CSE0_9BACL|nr:ArdC-like ssDNA-binding domain-containing protein [Alicyclobacillus ferrooxydans]KPV45760.1 hypothetical protein AN477_01895 [Alicyclobacillus ferrooxydans]